MDVFLISKYERIFFKPAIECNISFLLKIGHSNVMLHLDKIFYSLRVWLKIKEPEILKSFRKFQRTIDHHVTVQNRWHMKKKNSCFHIKFFFLCFVFLKIIRKWGRNREKEKHTVRQTSINFHYAFMDFTFSLNPISVIAFELEKFLYILTPAQSEIEQKEVFELPNRSFFGGIQ